MGPVGGEAIPVQQTEQLKFSAIKDTQDPTVKTLIVQNSAGESYEVRVKVGAAGASPEKIKEFAAKLFYLAQAHNVGTKKASLEYKEPVGGQAQLTVTSKKTDKEAKTFQADNIGAFLQQRQSRVEEKRVLATGEKARQEAEVAPEQRTPEATAAIATLSEKITRYDSEINKIRSFINALGVLPQQPAAQPLPEMRVNVQEQQLEEVRAEPEPEPQQEQPLEGQVHRADSAFAFGIIDDNVLRRKLARAKLSEAEVNETIAYISQPEAELRPELFEKIKKASIALDLKSFILNKKAIQDNLPQ